MQLRGRMIMDKEELELIELLIKLKKHIDKKETRNT